jgi:hypothetical protein
MKVTAKIFVLAAASATLAFAATPAFAANAPTLHGFCSSANPCSDNGTNTPTDQNPPEFFFSAGGHNQTGNVFIDILVPDNNSAPASFTMNSGAFTAALFSPTAWTSGQLDAYLGISAKPTNSIGAYTLQPGSDGFWVYQANLGTITLPSNSNANDSYLLTLDQGLDVGSYIVAFIHQNGKWGATANSGAIFETAPPPSDLPEPSTWATMLIGFGAAGVAMRRGRRNKNQVSQLA